MKRTKIFPLLTDGAALIAGMLLTFAFAPFGIYPFAIMSAAILLSTWLGVSRARAFFRGWLFGVGLFGTGVYWVYISIHTYGNASIFLAGFITAGFIAILALFPAATGYLLNRFFPKTNFAKLVCAFPAIWVTMEWVRSWIFTGFPWLFIGYSQIDSPLRGYAPLLSVYGVSLAVMLTAGLLINLITEKKQIKLIYRSVLFLTLIWLIGWGLSFIPWTQTKGAPIKVSLVQGSIPEQIKWSSDSVQTTIDRYVSLTQPHWDSQIIIWPESAVPVTLQSAQDFMNDIGFTALQHHTTFITGIPIALADNSGYYNAVIALGAGDGFYLKRRLVPFGEYVPFHRWLHGLLDILNVPMSEFVSGKETGKLLTANGLKIAPFVCYEIAFPELVGSNNKHINMLLTVSNDAWFGNSVAQPQHLEMAQMRALEMGRPVLFVSNDGITAVIDSRGKIQSRAPQHQPYVLTDTVQPTEGRTPWQYFRMDPVLLIVLGFLLKAVFRRNK